MKRGSEPQMAMAAAMLGMQGQGGEAASFALALVMHTLRPWQPPTGAALERARADARKHHIGEDLAIFIPPKPSRLLGKETRDAYLGVLLSLKRLDALEGDARAEAIEQVKTLLGSR